MVKNFGKAYKSRDKILGKLYIFVKAQYDQKNSHGIDIDTVVEFKTENEVFPWWIPVLIVVEVVIFAGVGVWFYFVFRSRKKETEN